MQAVRFGGQHTYVYPNMISDPKKAQAQREARRGPTPEKFQVAEGDPQNWVKAPGHFETAQTKVYIDLRRLGVSLLNTHVTKDTLTWHINCSDAKDKDVQKYFTEQCKGTPISMEVKPFGTPTPQEDKRQPTQIKVPNSPIKQVLTLYTQA